MGLYEVIENLQKKSEASRQRVLLTLVLLSSFVLISVWLISVKKQAFLKDGLSIVPSTNTEKINADNKGKNGEQNLLEPLSSLKQGFSLFISDVKEKAEEFLSTTEELSSEQEKTKEESGINFRLPIVE